MAESTVTAATSAESWQGFTNDRGEQIETPRSYPGKGGGLLGWVQARWPGLIDHIATTVEPEGWIAVVCESVDAGVRRKVVLNAIVEIVRRRWEQADG